VIDWFGIALCAAIAVGFICLAVVAVKWGPPRQGRFFPWDYHGPSEPPESPPVADPVDDGPVRPVMELWPVMELRPPYDGPATPVNRGRPEPFHIVHPAQDVD
jgi:hypothetical protein